MRNLKAVEFIIFSQYKMNNRGFTAVHLTAQGPFIAFARVPGDNFVSARSCVDDESISTSTMVLAALVSEGVCQLLGTAGFVEIIFELLYVYSQWSIFTKFERFFFTFTAWLELFGEALALVGLLFMFRRAQNGRCQGHENHVHVKLRLTDMCRALLQDPVHNLARPIDFTRGDRDGSRPPGVLKEEYAKHKHLQYYLGIASAGVAVPGGICILFWVIFFPMWGMYDGEDYDLRLWICVSSWLWLVVAVLVIKFMSGASKYVFVVVTPYALIKTVEILLLFTRGKRLVMGVVGETLRTLQLLELISVACILYRTLTSEDYA